MESIHVNYIIKKPTIDSIKKFINDKNLTNSVWTFVNIDSVNWESLYIKYLLTALLKK